MSNPSTSRPIIPAVIQGNTVLAEGSNAISLHNKGNYGFPEKDGVRLNGFEALHLFELGRLDFRKRNKSEINEEYLTVYFSDHIDNFLLRYLVYKDLRNRGYNLNLGEGSSFFFRLYTRNSKPKQDGATYYVTPLQEGGAIHLKDLEDLIDIANKSQKILLFGMVDAVGDVSYLRVTQIKPNKLDNKIYSDFKEWDWEKSSNEYDNWEASKS